MEKKRKENGDVDFGSGKFDWRKYQKWRHIYVFQYFDDKIGMYRPYFGLDSSRDLDERQQELLTDPNYKEAPLYDLPFNPPDDFYFEYQHNQLRMFIDYFKEVFEEKAFIDGYMPSHKFFKVVLPKKLYYEILNCINSYELLHISSLLLEIISVAQEKYVEEIEFWERPENQRLVATAEVETKNAYKVVEKIDTSEWIKGKAKRPPELLRINFVFQDETVKVSHPWLAKEFIEHFKRYYDKLPYKDWKVDLLRYPERFEDNRKKQQFKYKLALSLYNLLTKENFFILDEHKFPNDLMLFIAKIIEFCLIPVGKEENDDIKIKLVRNWLKRNKLEEGITYIPLPVNRDKLLKYFPDYFIDNSSEEKRADALGIAYYLSKRFDAEHLFPDLAHIAQSLKHSWYHLDFPRLVPDNESKENQEPLFNDFDAMAKLLKSLKEKRKIKGLKFKLEDDESEYEISERLPLYLIEKSLKYYIENSKEEFNKNVTKKIITPSGDGSYFVKQELCFNLPEERFIVRFVKGFYNYLLTELPPKDNEYMPSKKYYTIIALMLQETWFFSNKLDDERDIAEKVKGWHLMDNDT
jgi:ABC-type maltose transport system permease subunit